MQSLENYFRGIYFLEIILKSDIKIKHKKFSGLIFRKGFYYYSGSAQKNLSSRIQRHCTKEKKLRWHIDYLTSERDSDISKIFIFPNEGKEEECKASIALSKLPQIVEIRNFGNSDCTQCNTHLYFSKTRIDYSHLFSLYQDTVLFIPSSKEIFCSQPKSFKAF